MADALPRSRRQFLKASAMGASGVAIGAAAYGNECLEASVALVQRVFSEAGLL